LNSPLLPKTQHTLTKLMSNPSSPLNIGLSSQDSKSKTTY
jgi:hypothetical protein